MSQDQIQPEPSAIRALADKLHDIAYSRFLNVPNTEDAQEEAQIDCMARALQSELSSARAANAGLLRDKERLDWLDAEALCPGRFLPVAALVVKVSYDRNSCEWANCVGSARQAIDTAQLNSAPRSSQADQHES